MDEKSLEIYKYVKPSGVGTHLLSVGAVFMILSFICICDSLSMIPMVLMMVLIFGVPALVGEIKYKNELDEIKVRLQRIEADSVEYEALLSNFRDGKRYFNDNLRAGKTWIFGKKLKTIYRINDIFRVYVYVHKTNFIENQRMLKFDGYGGKGQDLCTLQLKDIFSGISPDEAEMIELLKFLNFANPNIKFGYR